MSESVPIIIVNTDENPSSSKPVVDLPNDMSIWERNISEEFPVTKKCFDVERAFCEIGSPHVGYFMIASTKNNELDGKATIYNQHGYIVAQFNYEKGVPNGKCTFYNSSGGVCFRGFLKNGLRDGIGTEYDVKGNVIFDAVYKNGYQDPTLSNGIYGNIAIERDSQGNIVSVCHKDINELNHGICYFYANDKIQYISRWEHGSETEVLHSFVGNIMTSYRQGTVIYEGCYSQISFMEFVPCDPETTADVNNLQSEEEDEEEEEEIGKGKKSRVVIKRIKI